MSKYQPLWSFVAENGTDNLELTFSQIEKNTGFPIDHSFLKFKKDLEVYGFKAVKISMKEQLVSFVKIND